MHGYSSSEESEDPRRPRVQPANNGNNQDQKKKRKRRVPPQQSINRIWKRFSNRKFHKALSVLPFDPVTPNPASANRPNELLSEGYERAAEECRRKVQKIVRECKRVNMRYRDPGWDLDWDLKYQKGNCLNSLGSSKFELTKSTLLGSSDSVPKAVKRVHEIFEKPTFMRDLNGADVKQGGLGDCWIMAGMTAMANVEEGVKRTCVAYDTKIGIYGFVFYRDGEWVYSIIDDKLYLKSPCWDCPSLQRDLLQQIDREDVEAVYRKTYQTGSKALFFGQCKDQNETWVPLLEKAYAKAHGDYGSLSGGWIGEGLEDLSGGVTTELLSSDILDTDEFWDNEMSKVNQEFLFGCSTGLLEHGYGQRDGICEAHAYIVLEARTLKSGQRLVKLRNPWGKVRKGLWQGAWSDGSKEWTTDVQAELGHTFGSDSVFWISYEDLIAKYTHFDRTRLFRDPDWRSSQKWIGVDVPWKAEYHEKFHISLTKDSPLVLVMSQLDNRYWKGLQGQYTFRLHFRLHYQDRLGAEDYIVRSHGNYFMKRSVSVELPDMPAGNYVVYLKVTGERDGDAPSVEQVVKRELKERVEHPKLEQVGYAYDLAHSKAWDHMEKVAALRKKRDQQKASGLRQQERRHAWEKRRLQRNVNKQQAKKNGEKKQRAQDAREERKRQREREDEDSKKAEEIRQAAERLSLAEAEPAKRGQTDANETKDDSAAASDSSGSPVETPKSEGSVVVVSSDKKQDVPPISGPPPPARTESDKAKPEPVKREVKDDSDGNSSDSPVEDWEELYSSDDFIRKPRTQPVGIPPPRDEYDTEEEKMPDPWNAVCIVGFRVYSKDADLQLRTVMEGGELLEDGMGEKGEKDLDDAQANAAGIRRDADDMEARGSTATVLAAR
ncbi:calpain-like protein [Purpureocillium lilacinum]|uniref:Calpain-like protein n=1 Tax=Purpureocillium lilacinum TaxID=33203 RepID=A0A179HHG1_PURLI|nr:calpain-like protein [Purpureocillium lilacinum]OAQ89474.1 calpain-like protein [Purpureocillium lilacinum]